MVERRTNFKDRETGMQYCTIDPEWKQADMDCFDIRKYFYHIYM